MLGVGGDRTEAIKGQTEQENISWYPTILLGLKGDPMAQKRYI